MQTIILLKYLKQYCYGENMGIHLKKKAGQGKAEVLNAVFKGYSCFGG